MFGRERKEGQSTLPPSFKLSLQFIVIVSDPNTGLARSVQSICYHPVLVRRC